MNGARFLGVDVFILINLAGLIQRYWRPKQTNTLIRIWVRDERPVAMDVFSSLLPLPR